MPEKEQKRTKRFIVAYTVLKLSKPEASHDHSRIEKLQSASPYAAYEVAETENGLYFEFKHIYRRKTQHYRKRSEKNPAISFMTFFGLSRCACGAGLPLAE
jgi:hypothetical protein